MLRRLVIVVGAAGAFMAIGSAARASESVADRIARHRTELQAKMACHRAEMQGKPCAQAAPAGGGTQAAAQSGGAKRIEISLTEHRLRAFEGDRVVLDTPVSTGAGGTTPRGRFAIHSKEEMHWSTIFDVWMPKAMHVTGDIFIHQLPQTTDGRVIGANSLGQPVSHGCIRVGPRAASFLFSWARIGTPVLIQ